MRGRRDCATDAREFTMRRIGRAFLALKPFDAHNPRISCG
jgi:hypothetical protein